MINSDLWGCRMEYIKLCDICDFQGGSQPPKDEWSFEPRDGYIRMLQIRDFTQGERVTPEYIKITKTTKICKADDILIARYGASLGKILTGLSGAYNVAIMRTIPNTKLLEKKYLYYYLKSSTFQTFLLNIGNRAAQAGFNKKDLEELRIPNISREAQCEIVSILERVEAIISTRQQQLQKLDDLVKARFVELFGMPGTDDFGWGLVPLGSTCNINPKKSYDSRLVSGVEVSFVPMPAVTERGGIDTTSIKEYDEVKTGFTYFAENDVLFAKITPCMENGKGAVARGLHNGIGFGSTEFHVLRPISGKTNPYWIYTLTTFSQFRIDAANNMTGSAGQRRVPASFLENYQVSLPPFTLQEQFAAFVTQTDKSKLIK